MGFDGRIGDTAKSVLAGIAVSLGGAAFLASGQAFMFPIGLYLVCCYGLNLYTGRVGYVKHIDKPTLKWLLKILVCNLVAAYAFGWLIRVSGGRFSDICNELVDAKLKSNACSVMIRAILCNIFIVLAVDSYKKFSNEELGVRFSGILMLFLLTMGFVYCGFEHCVANAFYFGLAGRFEIKVAIFLAWNAFWNGVSGFVVGQILADLNHKGGRDLT